MKATIFNWNPERGFGFCEVNGRRVFVHYSVVSPRPTRGADLSGQEVMVEKVDWKASKGPRAVKVRWPEREERRRKVLEKIRRDQEARRAETRAYEERVEALKATARDWKAPADVEFAYRFVERTFKRADVDLFTREANLSFPVFRWGEHEVAVLERDGCGRPMAEVYTTHPSNARMSIEPTIIVGFDIETDEWIGIDGEPVLD